MTILKMLLHIRLRMAENGPQQFTRSNWIKSNSVCVHVCMYICMYVYICLFFMVIFSLLITLATVTLFSFNGNYIFGFNLPLV